MTTNPCKRSILLQHKVSRATEYLNSEVSPSWYDRKYIFWYFEWFLPSNRKLDDQDISEITSVFWTAKNLQYDYGWSSIYV